MESIEKKLFTILEDSIKKIDSACLALSGGLDSSIIAFFLKERKPKSISIITKEFLSSDLTYCQLISKKFSLPLELFTVEMTEVLKAIEETIKILGNFNDIEIRNSVVSYLAISKAKELGFKSIMTGDGADELFLGYNFLIKKEQMELDEERKRLLRIMHFPSLELGKAMGIKIHCPFLDTDVVEFSKKIPSDLLIRTENGIKYGKWILRKSFENKVPNSILWRIKTPMEEGSGTKGLTDFFHSIIPDKVFFEKKEEIQKSTEIEIRTKESLYYFETYQKYHKIDFQTVNGKHCPLCKLGLDQNSKFCRMCGMFPI